MKFKRDILHILGGCLALGLSSGGAVAQESAPLPSATTTIQETPAPSLADDKLQNLGKAYRIAPGPQSWQSYINEFKSYLSQAPANKSSGTQIINTNSSLKDLGVRLYDLGGGRAWAFPSVKEKPVLVLQVGAGADLLEYPAEINISDARLIRSLTTTTKVVRVKHKKVVQKVVTASGPSYLVLAGNNRANGLIWLKAYKPYNGAWVETTDPFSSIPPYLLTNVSGEVSFSGNNIVMAVSASDAKTNKLPKPNSTSYRITLASNGGKFSLVGSTGANQPLTIVTQFVQSLRNNRVDLAKAWLHDPKLISIPKYIDLVGKAGDKPYKLVAMAQPKNGGPRYRLVTHHKHDLIIDVGKVYQRLAIKGLFIAPPDPLAERLSGTLIGPAPVTPPAATEENPAQASASTSKKS